MSELQNVSDGVWAAVQTAIANARQKGGSLERVKEFIPYRRARLSKTHAYTMQVLRRTVVPTEWGANRGVAEQVIEFGITGLSFKPEDSAKELEELAFALADLFLSDPELSGNARDVRVEEIAPDATPEGMEESTQPWATVRLAWEYEFLRP
jgi:hypothetical protein